MQANGTSSYRQRTRASHAARRRADPPRLREIHRAVDGSARGRQAGRPSAIGGRRPRASRTRGEADCRPAEDRRLRSLRRDRAGPTRRTTIPQRQPVAGTDLVRRRFQASRPDELWVCDFTYVRTWERWAYLAIVLDVFSRRIVGWQLASHTRDRLVDDARQMAIARPKRPGEPLGAHTDNGFHGARQRDGRKRDRDDESRADHATAMTDTASISNWHCSAGSVSTTTAASTDPSADRHIRKSPTSTIETTALTQRRPPTHAGAKPGTLHCGCSRASRTPPAESEQMQRSRCPA